MRISGFYVEDLVIVFFDKSAKRKADLLEYCSFCDVSYTEIVNYVNTRWLSLERVAYRVLQQSAALDSFFFQKVFSGCIDDVQFFYVFMLIETCGLRFREYLQ